ncbi:MAG: CPBP family intramembrane metalloprotease [Promethearchaeota archaeon]|nr:MAG: CPBP family intramembrane metalloprotease [Candidatus Lokiarchaeota archaeon]
MENPEIESEKNVIINRFRFFLEVLIVFFGIFLFLLIPRLFLSFFLDEASLLYGYLYYILRAISILLAIPIFLYLSNFLIEPNDQHLVEEKEIYSVKTYLNLFSIPKRDFKEQFKHGILLTFIIFIPLDFLVYFLIPEMLEYSGRALTSSTLNRYLLESYFIFLFSVILIQICVSIYEETLSRGFLTSRGNEYFHKMSAVIIPSLYFGLMHFAYYLNPISRNYPIWFPFIWFLQTFLVAIILSIYILKKKKLFPVIFAHAVNNIISAHAIWNYLQGNDFMVITIYLYIPLLVGSLFVLAWQFSKIKNGISLVIEEIKTYFLQDKDIKNGESKVMLRIIFDVIITCLILIIGLFIFGI